MGIIRIIILILFWGIVIYRIVKHLKSNHENRELFKKAIQSPSFLLVDGLRYIGLALVFSGIISSISVLINIGVFLLCIGWFAGGIEIWDKNIKKSILTMTFAVMAAFSYYLILF